MQNFVHPGLSGCCITLR